MTELARSPSATGTARPTRSLGFNTRVPFRDDAGPAQGLRDGIALFRAAEELGYRSGWVYRRHFDHYLSSPLPFLVGTDPRTEARRRLDRSLAAVAGETLHVVAKGEGAASGQGAPPGTALTVTPHSPGLRGRIRHGVASTGSAVTAAWLGLGLITGTVLHGLEPGETFPAYQARVIDAYRTTWRDVHGTEPPPVAVAASIVAPAMGWLPA